MTRILYLDEIGHIGAFTPSSADPGTPIGGLGGICVHADSVAFVAGCYTTLKRGFFRSEFHAWSDELERLRATPETERNGEAWAKGKKKAGVNALHETQWGRIERFELKGTELFGGRAIRSARPNHQRVRFGKALLAVLKRDKRGSFTFARAIRKTPHRRFDENAFYGRLAQGIITDFAGLLEAEQTNGIVVLDGRTSHLNGRLIESLQSYIISRRGNQSELCRVIETPFFVDSRWYAGVQVADLICNIVHSLFRFRHCGIDFADYLPSDTFFGDGIDALAWRPSADWTSVHCHEPIDLVTATQ